MPSAHETSRPSPPASQATQTAEQQLVAIIHGPVDQLRTPASYVQLAMLRQQREYGSATQIRGPGECTNAAMWSAEEDPRALLRHVVEDFPNSEHVAGALMLLAYLEKDRCHPEATLRAALSIACPALSADAFAEGPFLLTAEGTSFASCTARPEVVRILSSGNAVVPELLRQVAVAYSQETKYVDAAATLDYLIAHFANAVTDEDRAQRARAVQGLP